MGKFKVLPGMQCDDWRGGMFVETSEQARHPSLLCCKPADSAAINVMLTTTLKKNL